MCPLSRASSVVYKVVVGLFLPVWIQRCCQLQSLLSPMNVLMARQLENRAKLLYLFYWPCSRLSWPCLGSLYLIETRTITLGCNP